MKLSVQHRLLVGNDWWDLGLPVLDAHQIGDRVVVVFDYMSFPKISKPRT